MICSNISKVLLADDTDVISIMGILWTVNKYEAVLVKTKKNNCLGSCSIAHIQEIHDRGPSWVDEIGYLFPVLTVQTEHGTSSECNKEHRTGSILVHWHLKSMGNFIFSEVKFMF